VIVACVRVPDAGGGRRQETRSFQTTTAALLTLLDWLRSYGVTLVGMESTGRLLAADLLNQGVLTGAGKRFGRG
jgi:hypothetical protein